MAVVINSADLVHKVVFKAPTKTADDSGGIGKTHATAFVTFADVEEVNQFRTTDANNTAIAGTKDFYIRWAENRDAINKDWLLEYKTKDYTITEIEHIDELKKFIRIRGKVKNG